MWDNIALCFPIGEIVSKTLGQVTHWRWTWRNCSIREHRFFSGSSDHWRISFLAVVDCG
jgi:hypothetical protein